MRVAAADARELPQHNASAAAQPPERAGPGQRRIAPIGVMPVASSRPRQRSCREPRWGEFISKT
jgi:hypothetical protein